jgi:hypothetical protein
MGRPRELGVHPGRLVQASATGPQRPVAAVLIPSLVEHCREMTAYLLEQTGSLGTSECFLALETTPGGVSVFSQPVISDTAVCIQESYPFVQCSKT